MNETIALLQELVRIDSRNPDLSAQGPGEASIAQFVANWLTRAGLDVVLEEAAPGRPNVIAVARGSGQGNAIMLNAHLDTVGVENMAEPFSGRIEGNRLYGRGAYDMKGGLAAIMMAAASAQQKQLAGDVILTAVVDEEYASIGIQDITRRWHADGAIITEPSGLKAGIAHKGFAWFEIETKGRAAHGSRPDLGIDAIMHMGHILKGIGDLQQRLSQRPPYPMLGQPSIHASTIQGGQELSAYPERCVLGIERRSIPGESIEQMQAELEAIIRAAGSDLKDFSPELRMMLNREAFAISPDAPIVQTLRAAAQRHMGHQPDFIGMPFWMDSAFLAAAKIPTVIFGPDGAGAHATVEWVDTDSVVTCQAVIWECIQDFCQ